MGRKVWTRAIQNGATHLLQGKIYNVGCIVSLAPFFLPSTIAGNNRTGHLFYINKNGGEGRRETNAWFSWQFRLKRMGAVDGKAHIRTDSFERENKKVAVAQVKGNTVVALVGYCCLWCYFFSSGRFAFWVHHAALLCASFPNPLISLGVRATRVCRVFFLLFEAVHGRCSGLPDSFRPYYPCILFPIGLPIPSFFLSLRLSIWTTSTLDSE